MLEFILITGSVLFVAWLFKKALGWLIGKIALPAQFLGYSLGLIEAMPKTGPRTNQIYLSKDGQYKIFQADGQELTGSLFDLSDIPGALTSEEVKKLNDKIKKLDKNLYDFNLTNMVLKITLARNQTPNARPKNIKIPGEFFVKTKNGKLSTLELKPKTGKAGDRYIICYCPNAVSYRQIIEDYQELADKNNATVICFDYPNVGNSTGSASSESQLIAAGKAQVERLFNKSIPANKITLYGHSLGGAVATIVAAHYHKKKKLVSLINDRSFSTTGDIVISVVHNPRLKSIIKNIANPFAWLLDWKLNAAAAYRSIPAQYKMLIVSKDDEIINYEVASVYKKEKAHVTKKAKNKAEQKELFYVYKQDNAVHKMQEMPNQFQHGLPVNTLKDRADQIPMMEKITKFIAKQ